MVTIRTLQPLTRIRLPSARRQQPSRVTVVRRLNRDFPPPTPQPTPCRLWQGTQGSDGYGWRKIYLPDGSRKSRSMHRWVMEQYLERRLRSSEVVLHACDNPLCYRIDHLSVGTIADNNADMKAKGRAVKPPINVFYGEAHPMAKLTAAQVRAIRGHYQSGLRVRTIATDYGVSENTIRRIVTGVTWATGPDRDLVAEFHERHPPASEESERLPPKRIRPVKKMPLTRKDAK